MPTWQASDYLLQQLVEESFRSKTRRGQGRRHLRKRELLLWRVGYHLTGWRGWLLRL